MLNSKRILTIVSNDYDDLEFHYPLIRLPCWRLHQKLKGIPIKENMVYQQLVIYHLMKSILPNMMVSS